MTRHRALYLAALGVAAAAALVLILVPRPPAPGTAIVLLASAHGESLAGPVAVQVGGSRLALTGAAPAAPDSRTVARLSLAPGTYTVTVPGSAVPATLAVRSNTVEPLLLAVAGGRLQPGGVYAGGDNVNLGLQELTGRLTALWDFHLTDQDGRALDRTALLGRDTVVAAFHTTCHETCPLYTALLFQLRRLDPAVRLVEVTTDPVTDTRQTLAAYRSRIGADWTFATGGVSDVAEFWAPFGVQPATGDSHTSALALVDGHGFIRAAYAGVPDVGGRLPAVLDAQLDPAGRQLVAGHGQGWGAPQVLDSLRTLAAAQGPPPSGQAPAFTLHTLDGRSVSLEEFRGRPVVLNFWFSGCTPCRTELPLLQQLADNRRDVTVLLVDSGDSPAAASQFVSSVHVRAPVLLDEDGTVRDAYRVAAFPTTEFIRPDGSQAQPWVGSLTPETLTSHVSNILAG
jgi:cytochrome oxidase Cu insertion factor (SCO1/SenC/PrrC family)